VVARRARLGPDFRRFWLAAAASNLGDGIRLGALPLLALRLTDNPTLIGATSAATIAPWVLAPLAGVLVDRRDRRRLMVIGQLGRAVLVGVLIALIVADALSIWVLLGVAVGLGVGEVIVDTTSQAALPQLVEPHQLDHANSRLQAATQVLDEVVGVALGAVLFARWTSVPFAVDAATFVLGGVLLVSLRRPLQGDRRAHARSVRIDLAEGFRFLRGQPFLRNAMFGAAVSNIATNMSFAVLVVLVVSELGASESAYGLVVAASALGGVLAAFVAGWLAGRVGRTRVLLGAPAFVIVGLAAVAAAGHVAVAAAAWFVIRFGIISLSVPAVSLRQAMTPEHLLGRVVASFRMVSIGAGPAGALLGGVLTHAAGVRTTNVVAVAVMVVATLLLANAVRHLGPTPAPTPP
jgi:MFS family permease